MRLIICEATVFCLFLFSLSLNISGETVQTTSNSVNNTFDVQQVVTLANEKDLYTRLSLQNRNRRRVIFRTKSQPTNESDTATIPYEEETTSTTPSPINIMSILNVPAMCSGKQRLDRHGKCRTIQS